MEHQYQMKTINVISDFHSKPYGRYKEDGKGAGVFFRPILAKALREHDKVKVILTGYNRYGRSFIDEVFGGLIREENFTKAELDRKLSYEHADVKSIEKLIAERIEAAERDRVNK
ncbi:STAS-like domain-containing protein [Vibrio metschnikovii]|nr:STAS-like domain-containing protein [Vibrio metschnikovii]EKO3691707.1 STAS-like domain-containing protein [Vibrio metschnikovii]EKO3781681.1 STAS-like domain-containing protein [Vibrio metschnikovii]EKO3888577.1 STAS-like domain-containing protein [Vibrio metschnikovii]EKO3936956.1 STAS-like domain-containing protein [Vibrio metschnikovii]